MELIEQYLPGWQAYIGIVLAAALTAFAITEIIKRGVGAYLSSHGGTKPWWWRTFLRLLAMLLGLGVALGLQTSFLSAVLGFLAGAFSSLIVYLILKKFEKNLPSAGDLAEKLDVDPLNGNDDGDGKEAQE